MGKLNSLERTIGLEFEFSNPKSMTDEDIEELLRQVEPLWVTDGSLHAAEGRELVTKPMKGDEFVQGVATIVALIKTLKPDINERCGYHVHVGAVDLNVTKLRNLILAWCAIERDVFDGLVRDDRKRNKYCIPLRASGVKDIRTANWQITKTGLKELAALTTAEEISTYLIRKFYRAEPGSREFTMQVKNKRAAGEGTGCFRYGALNLHSWWYRNTLEFRLKEGTADPEECIYWPLFCAWFVENMVHMPLKEVLQLEGLQSYLDIGKMPMRLKDWVREKMKNPPKPLAAPAEPQFLFQAAPIYQEVVVPRPPRWDENPPAQQAGQIPVEQGVVQAHMDQARQMARQEQRARIMQLQQALQGRGRR